MKKYFVLILLLTFCSSDSEESLEEVEIQIETTIGVEMADKVYDSKPEMNINT